MGRRRKGRPITGWLVLDKPEGITSTEAVNRVRRLFDAAKAGHGGTLDPMATGILPIAFGEATKTVPLITDGTKDYTFVIRWGEARSTDDREGPVIETSELRPSAEQIEAVLLQFLGEIEQVPPQFSAIKVQGERAYDLARGGAEVVLEARPIWIDRIALTRVIDADHAELAVVSGKGAYMRALARDIARALGTVGHVARLRRTRVGALTLDRAVSLDELERLAQEGQVDEALIPIEQALDDIPALSLDEPEARRLKLGQPVALLRKQHRDSLDALHRHSPDDEPLALALFGGRAIALVRVAGADATPVRIFNL